MLLGRDQRQLSSAEFVEPRLIEIALFVSENNVSDVRRLKYVDRCGPHAVLAKLEEVRLAATPHIAEHPRRPCVAASTLN